MQIYEETSSAPILKEKILFFFLFLLEDKVASGEESLQFFHDMYFH